MGQCPMYLPQSDGEGSENHHRNRKLFLKLNFTCDGRTVVDDESEDETKQKTMARFVRISDPNSNFTGYAYSTDESPQVVAKFSAREEQSDSKKEDLDDEELNDSAVNKLFQCSPRTIQEQVLDEELDEEEDDNVTIGASTAKNLQGIFVCSSSKYGDLTSAGDEKTVQSNGSDNLRSFVRVVSNSSFNGYVYNGEDKKDPSSSPKSVTFSSTLRSTQSMKNNESSCVHATDVFKTYSMDELNVITRYYRNKQLKKEAASKEKQALRVILPSLAPIDTNFPFSEEDKCTEISSSAWAHGSKAESSVTLKAGNGNRNNSLEINKAVSPADKFLHAESQLNLTFVSKFFNFYQSHYTIMFPNTELPFNGSRKKDNTASPTIHTTFSFDAVEATIRRDEQDLSMLPELEPIDSQESSDSSDAPVKFVNLLCSDDNSVFQGYSVQGDLFLDSEEKSNSKLSLYQSHKEIAICEVASSSKNVTIGRDEEPMIVRIYSNTPIYKGQTPSSNRKYFPWADVIIQGEFPLPMKYYIKVHSSKNKKELKYKGVSKQTSTTIELQHCQNSEPCLRVSLKENGYFNLEFFDAVPEVELLTCFTSITDHVVCNIMKQQYRQMDKQKKSEIFR